VPAAKPGARAVALLVVRHARAGHRSEWEGDDRLRPLDEKGRRQAAGLPSLLARFEIARIASGSYLRCMQTVEPLSQQRGLPIEERRELDEGASLEETLALLRELGDDAVLCTQGDVLENLFGESGQKGSTRIVELEDGEPVVLDYVPPPA
jgi:broad specificity phosphatase PhoE